MQDRQSDAHKIKKKKKKSWMKWRDITIAMTKNVLVRTLPEKIRLWPILLSSVLLNSCRTAAVPNNILICIVLAGWPSKYRRNSETDLPVIVNTIIMWGQIHNILLLVSTSFTPSIIMLFKSVDMIAFEPHRVVQKVVLSWILTKLVANCDHRKPSRYPGN